MYKILTILAVVLLSSMIYAQDTNLARQRIVSHSSSCDVNQCGHLVVDGSIDTYWESLISRKSTAPFSEWLLIDLGTPQLINKVHIYWGSNYAIEYKVFLSSSHGTKGKEIFSSNDGNGSDPDITTSGITAQYIRLEIKAVKNPIRGCIVNEIEVLGEGPDRFIPSPIYELSESSLSLDGDIWRIQNAMFVKDAPKDISSEDYNDLEWIPAKVPGTILGDYYNFGALPDPLYGDNMHQISDRFFSGNDFWYRTSVSFPANLSGKKIFLNFSGINWKSDIYFNGRHLGKIDGAFMRGEFDVSDLVNVNEANTIAVLVHHNDNWVSGEFKIIRKYLGARTTNGDMLGLDGPTSLASAGWNWLPIIRGRNNGIWNHANFQVGGNISIKDPWVSSTLSLPDTTRADLSIHTDLKNHSSEPLEGILVVQSDAFSIEQAVKLKANETLSIELNKSQFSELSVDNPKLWWPNGYGQANLTKLQIQFIENGELSDQRTLDFGIRQLDYKVIEGVLFVYCNGQRIQLKGGNWGLPEAMMRLDSAGYDLRVRLHKDAHLNMIRNWIGMTNKDDFYKACDRYGVLIFDDFWLANPKNGPDPEDFDLFMENVRDKIKWVRKHPSLAIYCGRNEGLPPLKYDLAMEKETERLDGTRYYVPHSAAGTVSGFGPYDVRSPQYYFETKGKTLHSELGIIAIPEVESIRKMMPAENLWPINDMWAIHNYQEGRSEKYTKTIDTRYGKASSIEEYSGKAQLLNYETGKAMMECLQSKQGSGMLLWMSQSAWPSMICQLYDHYLEYTASYFAVKKAAAPIHILLDSEKNEIIVANNTASDLSNVSARASIFNNKGRLIWSNSVEKTFASASATSCFPLDHQAADQVRYLKLELKDDNGSIADNFYWLENKNGDCLDLNELPAAKIKMKVSESSDDRYLKVHIKLKNQSDVISLLNKIKVKETKNGESILPIFLNDDYVSLLPGEERVLELKIEKKYLKDKNVEVHLEGWNTQLKKVTLNKI